MQGLGRILAGAALLASAYGATFQQDRAWADEGPTQADDIAFAVPRIDPPFGGNVPLATPLDPSQVEQARDIYALQKAGKFTEAAARSTQLGQTPLSGSLEADRLLRERAAAPATALAAWLAAHADEPEAPQIHALLLRIAPSHVPSIPAQNALAPESAAATPPEDLDQTEAKLPRNPALEATLLAEVRANRLDAAERLLTRTRGLSSDYQAVLQAKIARVLFTQGDDTQAFTIASTAWNRNRRFGQPAYIAGLAAWREGHRPLARLWFAAAALAPHIPASQAAGAAFWAARAAHAISDETAAHFWLTRAADRIHTFYGLLAGRLLGRQIGFGHTHPILTEADVQAIAATPEGIRAFALLQVGRPADAETEFRLLWPKLATQAQQRALLLVAGQAQLTDLAAQLAELIPGADGMENDLTRFPVPALHPAHGFTVDQSLVYALVRIESNFQPDAESGADAHGLLQLSTTTAAFLSREADLEDPAQNLALGQRYLTYLAHTQAVNQNLVRLLAAYNAGPAAMARWQIEDQNDPLLYIESIPVDETRAYVPRALAYSWIYAARFHQQPASLESLAAGAWPKFPKPEAE